MEWSLFNTLSRLIISHQAELANQILSKWLTKNLFRLGLLIFDG